MSIAGKPRPDMTKKKNTNSNRLGRLPQEEPREVVGQELRLVQPNHFSDVPVRPAHYDRALASIHSEDGVCHRGRVERGPAPRLHAEVLGRADALAGDHGHEPEHARAELPHERGWAGEVGREGREAAGGGRGVTSEDEDVEGAGVGEETVEAGGLEGAEAGDDRVRDPLASGDGGDRDVGRLVDVVVVGCEKEAGGSGKLVKIQLVEGSLTIGDSSADRKLQELGNGESKSASPPVRSAGGTHSQPRCPRC